MTLFSSRSQHLTDLSSPHENKYGCLSENSKALIVLMCPVREIFSYPEAKSQNFMVLSAEPVAKKVLQGETATALTHPWWPAITLQSLQGACHLGLISFLIELARIVPNFVAQTKFISSLLLMAKESSDLFQCLTSSTLFSYFSNVFTLFLFLFAESDISSIISYKNDVFSG